MTRHRMNCRRSGVRPSPESDGRPESPLSRAVSVEEGAVPDVDRLRQPAGFVSSTSTTSTSPVLVDSYEVPDQTTAVLREVSLSLDSEGVGRVHVAGETFGPISGPVDLTLPLDPAVLTPGYQVTVTVLANSGNSTTATASVVALED
jgi:hypothetical protein